MDLTEGIINMPKSVKVMAQSTTRELKSKSTDKRVHGGSIKENYWCRFWQDMTLEEAKAICWRKFQLKTLHRVGHIIVPSLKKFVEETLIQQPLSGHPVAVSPRKKTTKDGLYWPGSSSWLKNCSNAFTGSAANRQQPFWPRKLKLKLEVTMKQQVNYDTLKLLNEYAHNRWFESVSTKYKTASLIQPLSVMLLFQQWNVLSSGSCQSFFYNRNRLRFHLCLRKLLEGSFFLSLLFLRQAQMHSTFQSQTG